MNKTIRHASVYFPFFQIHFLEQKNFHSSIFLLKILSRVDFSFLSDSVNTCHCQQNDWLKVLIDNSLNWRSQWLKQTANKSWVFGKTWELEISRNFVLFLLPQFSKAKNTVTTFLETDSVLRLSKIKVISTANNFLIKQTHYETQLKLVFETESSNF